MKIPILSNKVGSVQGQQARNNGLISEKQLLLLIFALETVVYLEYKQYGFSKES